TVAFVVAGLPAGASASFNPPSVTAGQSSTLTVTTTTGATVGTSTLTITGTATSGSHTATASLTITAPPPPDDFSISASPASAIVQAGGSVVYTISTAVTSGNPQTVALFLSGLPAGASASFNPASVTSGGSSSLTVTASPATTLGTVTLAITGTAASGTHTTTASLTVIPPPNDFSISVSPGSATVQAGGAVVYMVSTAVTSGSSETVDLSVGGLPGGVTASFSPAQVSSGGSSTLTVTTTSAATPGTVTLIITGTAASGSHTATADLTVTPPPPPDDFSLSISPTSATVLAGGTVTYTVSTAVTSGNSELVDLSVSGLPSGVTASLSSTSVTSGSSATLTVSASAGASPGTATLTVTGSAASGTHTASASLTVESTVIVNGGFEDGFTGWTRAGVTRLSRRAHSGRFSARVGSRRAFFGDSSLAQTFTVPSSGGVLSFFYRVVCRDSVFFDWATVTLTDNVTGQTTTVLPRTCTNNGVFVQRTFDLGSFAGHSVTLRLIDHDDDFPGDPTHTLFDDVSVQ
ncbi:MAG TPA: hypothetical protein VKN99_26015, partial [Polyangia bacterium]|nr:hypothetical protein [Polyangia bacterium]